MSERREVAPGVWIEAEKLPPEAMDRVEDAVLREVTAHLKGCRTVHLTFEKGRVWTSNPEVLEIEGYHLCENNAKESVRASVSTNEGGESGE